MQYLLLIYEESGATEGMDKKSWGEMMAGYKDFNTWLTAKGMHSGGNALHPVSTATSVRIRGGETLVTDGPFAETKEQLAGYYLVDAPDLDAALEAAKRIPGATIGAVEVRPVRDLSSFD